MAKIIPILKNTTSRPLSPLMIKTLRAACKMQDNNEAIGQNELDGSFIALLKRSYIDSRTITVNGKNEVSWYVTRAGKNSLRKLGFNDC
ncbi:MAG: hypothetical protein ABI416_03795 [Ginsengibacter sp.]